MIHRLVSIAEAVQITLEALRLKIFAFNRTFRKGGNLRSPDGAEVLRDLAKFCRAFEPCWGSTSEETARYIGRNEVWHRIMEYMHNTPEELYDMRGGKYPLQQLEEENHA